MRIVEDMAIIQQRATDLIIGIDVGTTGTGVAYLLEYVKNNEVQVFPWFKQGVQEPNSKVPTQLRYYTDNSNQTAEPASWGFDAEEYDGAEQTFLAELFKTDFGRTRNESSAAQETTSRYYRDFLNKLYDELRSYFTPVRMGNRDWEKAVVHFHFSVPATWDNNTVTSFDHIIRSTAFSSCVSHLITVELTEPQAAAAHKLTNEPGGIQKGNTALIIDAGGGTVDLCWVKINNTAKDKVQVEEICKVQGEDNGAIHIDRDFESLIRRRLEDLQARGQLVLDVNLEDAAGIMRDHQRYKVRKSTLGRYRFGDDQSFAIPLPQDLGAQELDDEQTNVQQGHMHFTFREMKSIFDRQIRGIHHELQSLLDQDEREAASDLATSQIPKVDFLLLCGGLGSNNYVHQEMEKFIRETRRPQLRGAQVLEIQQPTLCVARGLVVNARQVASGTHLFTVRRSKVAVGVLCELDYDHPNLEGCTDKAVQRIANSEDKVRERDGQKVIVDYIQWFVHLNDKTDEIGIHTHEYGFDFPSDLDESDRKGTLNFVTCSTPDPPQFFDDVHVKHQKSLNLNLSTLRPEKPRKRDFLSRNKPVRVKFDVQVTVGQAKLNFQALDPVSKHRLGDDAHVPIESQREPLSPVDKRYPKHLGKKLDSTSTTKRDAASRDTKMSA